MIIISSCSDDRSDLPDERAV